MSFAVEVVSDMGLPKHEAKTKKSVFVPLEEEGATFLVKLFPNVAVSAQDADSRVGLILLTELCVDHYLHAPRLLFAPLLAALDAAGGGVDGGWVETLLANIVSQRGADIFPTWGECFHKTETASSKVLTLVVQSGAAIDSTFLEKVQGRMQKRVVSPSSTNPTSNKAASDALKAAAKKGKIVDVQAMKRQQQQADEAAHTDSSPSDVQLRTHGSAPKTGSLGWTLVKVTAVLGLTAALFFQANATK
jgi:hypothetical protein